MVDKFKNMKKLIFDTKKWLIEINGSLIIYKSLQPNRSYTIHEEKYKVYDSFEECVHDLESWYFVDLNKFQIDEDLEYATLFKHSKRLTKEEIKKLTPEQKIQLLSN